jgi:hypothetical protein
MSEVPSELKQVESLLARLAPEAGRLNRDRLLYEAGRAAAPRRIGWPLATFALAGLTSVLSLQLATRPAPDVRTVEVVRWVNPLEPRLIETPWTDGSSEARAAAPANNYLSLRERVLRDGPDALPPLPIIIDRALPEETIERGIGRVSRPG